MPARAWISKIKKITENIVSLRNRPINDRGEAGSLVDVSGWAKKPLIVGDLHAEFSNLKSILDHEDNYKALKNKKKVLILLGDIVHNDQQGHLKEMQTSLETLEYVIELFLEFPRSMIMIRGNHDTFDEYIVKNAIRQGLLFKNHLLEHRGPAYVKEVEIFFESLPLFIIGKGFVLTHAGPVRGGLTRKEIINASLNPDHYKQFIWNRINEFRGTPSAREYGEHDITRSLEKLNLPPATHFIVGHNPLWNTGNRTGIWQDVLGIKGHHILYSGARSLAPYLVFERDEMQVKYALQAQKEASYA